jgi:hypothetical protein
MTKKTKEEEKTPLSQFKSPELAAIVGPMLQALPTFEGRRKGDRWRSIMITLSNVYPEDAQSIYNLFAAKPKIVKTGARAVSRKRGKNAARKTSGCASCPPDKAVGGLNTNSRSVAPEPVKVARTAGEYSLEDVIAIFEGSDKAMLAYCQRKEISLPTNTKKAETIAKYILEHVNKNKIEL